MWLVSGRVCRTDIYPRAIDVKGLNTEPHTFPFDLKCRSAERWEVLEREAEEATTELMGQQ